ncbi:serine/threonine-protein kinase [Nocardia sp. NPDC059240]|uniref:serine/threonine-protein kinase n=1 Tax=Nocardia sp. NPDC059240 TaxID=3346786 RepID=UPI0036B069E0
MEGTRFGRYQLEKQLGAGGMGQVYRAYDTGTERTVAVKVLHAQFAADPIYRERFRREAKSAAGLGNPHVVPIYDYGAIDGHLFICMQLLDGEGVDTLLARTGAMPPEQAVSVVAQAAEALDTAHAAGLVHRDVKPSNLFITPRGFVYLIDFGIAHAAGETKLTSVGATIGTFAYMAPERFATGIVDAGADEYALACVLFELLTGDSPYPAASLEQQLAAHMMMPPPQPSLVRPELGTDIDVVVARGMAKNPAERYGSCDHLAAAARQALAGTHPAATVFATRTDEEQYRKAAAAGNANAMGNLGYLLEQRGDLSGAEDWYRRGAAAGDEYAMGNLGYLLEQHGDLSAAEDWYRRAAAVGNSDAMTNLGYLLEQRGDSTEAESWYRKAAAEGDGSAMGNLGFLLEQRGDTRAAESWYRESAAAGNSDAMNNLGVLLEQRSDLRGSEEWYRKAIGAGSEDAMHNLQALLEHRGGLRG